MHVDGRGSELADALPVAQIAETVYSFGSLIQHVDDIANKMASKSIEASQVGKALQGFRLSIDATSTIYDNLPRVSLNLDIFASALSEVVRGMEVAPAALERLSSYFDLAFESLASSFPEVDWRALRNGHRMWGKYGWVVCDGFPFSYVSDPPQSLNEANALAMKVMRSAQLEEMFDELLESIPKAKDAKEAIVLYRERRYKPCAMMLFSLIDCELYKEDWRMYGREGKGNPSRPLNAMRQTEDVSSTFALSAEGAFHAQQCFYKSGGGAFRRENEGELNRNFLMHGMTYKRVTRQSCTKLFALLNCICRLKMRRGSS